MADEMRWLPLESNPEVMNKYKESLGVPESWQFMDIIDTSCDYLAEVPRPVVAVLLLLPRTAYVAGLGILNTWKFVDVFGLDPELLVMVPQPVAAVLLLYPLNKKTEGTPLGREDSEADLYYMKQTIGNACGTVGLIHALCNNTDKLDLDESKHLSTFYSKTKSLTPEERGKYLANDKKFSAVHEGSALEGQTAAPSREDHVNLHFIAFVHHKGGLYELDGRKDCPVRHGDTAEDTLLQDTVAVVKKFMALDPENLNFTMVALSKA